MKIEQQNGVVERALEEGTMLNPNWVKKALQERDRIAREEERKQLGEWVAGNAEDDGTIYPKISSHTVVTYLQSLND